MAEGVFGRELEVTTNRLGELLTGWDLVHPQRAAALAVRLRHQLLDRLTLHARRVLITELHRHREQLHLPADPRSSTATDSFTRLLHTPAGREALRARYPLLVQDGQGCADALASRLTRLRGRLDADRDRLTAAGLLGSGSLEDIDAFLGDPHDGEHVVDLQVGTRRLIYKPRDPGTDLLWNRAVGLLDPRNRPGTVPVLPGPGYGWHGAALPGPPLTRAQARGFDERLGVLLALAAALALTDLHTENVVPAGPAPVVIDTETLFTASRFGLTGTGMLPGCDATGGPELAAISAAGIRDGVPRYVVVHPGTDAMGIQQVPGPLAVDGHRPLLVGAPGGPADVDVDAVLTGLRSGLEQVRALRGALADLARGADCPVRSVPRPSQVYATFAEALRQPDALADAGRREQILGLLTPVPGADCEQERAALRRLDLPRIQVGAPGRAAPTLVLARDAAAHWHAAHASLTGLTGRDAPVNQRLISPLAEPDDARALARTLAGLDRLATRDEHRRVLARPGRDREGGRHRSDDGTLYGAGGTALLVALSGGDPDAEAGRLARAPRDPSTPLCAYQGLLSSALLVHLLSRRRPALTGLRDELIGRALAGADLDRHRLDVVGGAASGLVVLTGLAPQLPAELAGRARELVREGTRRLLDAGPGEPGFAHGSDGRAWALARLLAAGAPAEPEPLVHELRGYLDEQHTPASPSWCRGATGQVLARTWAATALHRCGAGDADRAGREAGALLGVTWSEHTAESLCHGAAGTAVVAGHLAALIGDDALHTYARRWRTGLVRAARAGELTVDDAGWGGGVGLLTGVGGLALARRLTAGPGPNPLTLTGWSGL